MSNSRFIRSLFLAVVAGAFALSTPNTRAAEWIGSVGYWNNPANWNGGVPDAAGGSSIANISNDGTAIVSNTVPTVNEVWPGNNGGAGNVIVTNGGTLTINNWLVIARMFQSASVTPFSRVTIQNGTVNKTGDGLIVGDNFSGMASEGELVLAGTGTLNVTGGWFGIGNGSGSKGTLILKDNATINCTNQDFNVGDYGASQGQCFLQDNAKIHVARFWVGKFDNSFGRLLQSGGAIVGVNGTANEWTLGGQDAANVDSFGYYNLSAGTFSTPYNFHIGRNGKGVLYQSGGTITAGTWTSVGRFTTGMGVVWVSGGQFTHTGTGAQLFVGESGHGEFNLTGTGALDCAAKLRLGNPGGSGIVNFNGGTAALPGIEQTGGSGTVNFNGATIQAKVSTTTFMGGLTEARVYGGNAIFNTAGQNITIAQPLLNGAGQGVLSISVANGGSGYLAPPIVQISGDGIGATAVAQVDLAAGTVTNILITCAGNGYSSATATLIGGGAGTAATLNSAVIGAVAGGGLVKNGAGTLTLSGANTYSGPTTLNAGKLIISTDSSAAGSYTAANNAGFGVTTALANGQANVSSLTLSGPSSGSLDFDLGGFGNPTTAPLNVTGNLSVGGPITVNIADALPQVGQFALLKYNTRSGAGSFVLGTLPSGVQATIVDNTANKSIDLNITGVGLPRWDGQAGGNWDINVTTNWVELSSGLPTKYTEGAPVLFDDQALGTTTVNLVATVNPGSVRVTNSTLSYTLSGPGKISGATGLTKQGSGTLTIANAVGNEYTGVTRIEGGTLNVPNLANGGQPSSIGRSSSASSNLVLAGGTLAYTGPPVTTDRGYLVAGGGALNLQNNVTVSGQVAATSGGFTKSGPGTLTYTATTDNNRLSAGGGVGAYVISEGGVVLSGAAQTNRVNGEVWIGQGAGSTGRVDLVNGATFETDTWTIIGRGGGAGSVNITNATLNHINAWDLIVGADAGSVGELNLTGNSVINNNFGWFLIGVGGATGTFNQYSGLYTNLHDWMRMYVGRDSGSIGTYNFRGGTVSLGNDLHVGVQSGQGMLTLSNSVVFTERNGWAFIGGNFDGTASSASVGTVTLADSSRMTLSGRLYVGFRQGVGTLNLVGGNLTKNSGAPLLIGVDGGVGVINHSAGTNTVPNGEVWVGQGVGGNGTYNLSGSGVFIVNNNWLAVGREGASGILNINGGSLTKSGGGNISIAHGGGPGTVNQTGGSFTSLSGETWIGEDSNTGTWTMSGGMGTHTTVHLAQTASATGILNLDGGTLAANEVTTGNTSGTSTLNFNGGTLRARVSNPNFLHDLSAANVLAGGAVIDTGANNVSIAQALLSSGGGGGLTKTGTGTLTLNGVNSYTGPTVVNAGTLAGTGTISGSLNNNATLAPGDGGIGVLTVTGNIVLGAGSTNVFEVNGTAPANDAVIAGGSVAYGGVLRIVTSGTFTSGQKFVLFSGAGATNTSNFASIQSPGSNITFTNGVLTVLSAIANNPTNITAIASGNTLTVSWPSDHLGWTLYSNSVGIAAANQWFPLAGSSSVTSTNLTINKSRTNVFFRLQL